MKVKKEEEKFGENQLVWAGMRYCPYWPAKTVAAPPFLGKVPPNKTCVLFFGTKQYGLVEKEKILPYVEHRSKYAAKGRGLVFQEAVDQMEAFILDPEKNKSNVFVEPNKIVIKTEHDVEKSLGIKREKRSESTSNTIATNATVPNSKSWAEEKQALIDKIVQLKTENQESMLNLKQSEEKVEVMTSANQELRLKISQCADSHLNTISSLRSELSDAKVMIDELKANNDKCVSELTRERDLAQAKSKQLENTIAQNQQGHESEESDEIHEVESILRDKLVQKRAYLVRWNGYDSSEDSWVLESNLRCPDILKKYKQSQRKK